MTNKIHILGQNPINIYKANLKEKYPTLKEVKKAAGELSVQFNDVYFKHGKVGDAVHKPIQWGIHAYSENEDSLKNVPDKYNGILIEKNHKKLEK